MRSTKINTCALRRSGFTLVELLVVIAIISLLLSMLMPAVQMARESARQTQCRNNLRQITVGLQNFHSTYGRFPGNGWGYAWIGEPDRAAGKSQPGGWIFQILPQLEQATLWSIGSGLTGSDRAAALSTLCSTPLPVFKCPSRASELLGPPSLGADYRNADVPSRVARTDYAINEGDFITRTPGGPLTLTEGDAPGYLWTDVSMASGVSWLRDGVRIGMITDGASNTYLVGEKYVSRLGYHNPVDRGHDQPMYSGVDLDNARWTLQTPIQDEHVMSERSFGSAHSSVCFMSLCDGSVRAVSYSIDAEVHRNLGNRADGNVVSF
jgi:prepilin-type N-terminal cleavage/methylation domain-containing protein